MYEIQFRRSAGKELKRLPRKEQLEIAAVIEGLKKDPKPPGHKRLQGYEDHPPIYRVYCACGAYRILYTVKEKFIIVLVLKVGLRSTVYSDFADMMKGIKSPPKG